MTGEQQALKKGVALQKAGRLLEAAQIYSDLMKQDPKNANAWHLMGTIEIARRNFDQAHKLITRAVALNPRSAIFRHNLAYVLGAQSRVHEAVNAYRRAVELDPDYAEAYFNLAQSIDVEPGDPVIEGVNRLIESPDLSEQDSCFLHFAAGKIYDDLDKPDRAFAHYRVGNLAKHARPNPAYGTDYLNGIIRVFDDKLMEARFGVGSDSTAPIFIVGMPRSGTSLAEQILASHPEVHGAGELPLIELIAGRLSKHVGNATGYPECVPSVPDAAFKGFAKSYLDAALAPAPGHSRLTDKAPLNFRHLGLIALLFPLARIIHVRRNPLDTCLSCYFQNFAQGQEYSFDLKALGQFYCDYRRMMSHWRRVLPGAIFELEYEALIDDQQAVSRKLLGFCGLDWHEDCERFFETKRPVLTASRIQVRQPVYRSSIGRWQRYAHHLEPLIEALGHYADAALRAAPPLSGQDVRQA